MERIYMAWNSNTQRVEPIKPWDGTCERFPGKRYKDCESLFIGGDGTIFYFPYGSETPSIWCGHDELNSYLYQLDRILDGGAMVQISL